MKRFVYLIIIILTSIVLLALFFVRIGGGCDPPIKPSNVPEKAVWKGGCDGGYWIELVSIEKDTVRFRIYIDWNGDLLLDAYFKYEACHGFRLTDSNWENHVAYFGNAIEIYNSSGGSSRCRLEPIYPAIYDGY